MRDYDYFIRVEGEKSYQVPLIVFEDTLEKAKLNGVPYVVNTRGREKEIVIIL